MLGKFLEQDCDARRPESGATVSKLMDEYAAGRVDQADQRARGLRAAYRCAARTAGRSPR